MERRQEEGKMIQAGVTVGNYAGSAVVEAGTPVHRLGRIVGEKGEHGTGRHPELFSRVLLPKTGFTSWWVLTQWTQLNQEGRGEGTTFKRVT